MKAKRRHTIRAVHFEPKGSTLPSWCCCICGWQGSEATPELLDEAWREHRRAVGAPARTLAIGYDHTVPFKFGRQSVGKRRALSPKVAA